MDTDVNVKVSPPREGLPPCLRLTEFDGRLASWASPEWCDARHMPSPAHIVIAFTSTGRCPPRPWMAHQYFPRWRAARVLLELETDDPAEAEAAYARACEWVRTGEL